MTKQNVRFTATQRDTWVRITNAVPLDTPMQTSEIARVLRDDYPATLTDRAIYQRVDTMLHDLLADCAANPGPYDGTVPIRRVDGRWIL